MRSALPPPSVCSYPRGRVSCVTPPPVHGGKLRLFAPLRAPGRTETPLTEDCKEPRQRWDCVLRCEMGRRIGWLNWRSATRPVSWGELSRQQERGTRGSRLEMVGAAVPPVAWRVVGCGNPRKRVQVGEVETCSPGQAGKGRGRAESMVEQAECGLKHIGNPKNWDRKEACSYCKPARGPCHSRSPNAVAGPGRVRAGDRT